MPQEATVNPGFRPAAGPRNWYVHSMPSNVGSEHPNPIKLSFKSSDGNRLSDAGYAAILAQIATYQASAKVTTLRQRANHLEVVGCHLTVDGGWYHVLPEDATAQGTAILAILNTAANLL